MYLSALTNHPFTKAEIIELYNKKLNNIGDVVLVKQRFGIDRKVNKLMFLKIKNLLPVISADIVTIPYNKFYTVLNND